MTFETKEKPAKIPPQYIHDMADTIPTEGTLPGVSGRDGGLVRCESDTATVERGDAGPDGVATVVDEHRRRGRVTA